MTDDAAQTIVLLIILVAVVVIVFVPFTAFIVYVVYQNSKRKRIRERIVNANQQLIADREWMPVRYAAEPRFKSFFKLFPWDTAGVLILANGSVLFLGEHFNGTPVQIQFSPINSAPKWLGKVPWPNGAVSWFEFETANGRHYFSSETGILVFGSHKTTKAIYDRLAQGFASNIPSAT
jgi:hypothetical protein